MTPRRTRRAPAPSSEAEQSDNAEYRQPSDFASRASRAPSRDRGRPRGTAVISGPGRVMAGAGRSPSTQTATAGLFIGYLVLVFVEYSGLQNVFPVLKVVRFSTLLAYGLFAGVVIRVGFGDCFAYRQTKILLGFLVFTILSMSWAVVTKRAFDQIRPMLDYTVFFFVTLSLVDNRKRLDQLAWVLLAVVVLLVLRNADKLGSAVRAGAFKAAYFMGDGNDFAWGLAVVAPLVLVLATGTRKMLVRTAGILGAALCAAGVIGTASRGGSIAFAVAMVVCWLMVSKRKAIGAAVLLVAATAVLVVAPATYFDRMKTVGSYSKDNSAQSRLQAWGAATRMAMDHPLGVGAGNFPNAYGRYYMPRGDANRIEWASGRWLSAHSIYFRVLGEYGFLGLLMLLSLIATNVMDNYRMRQHLAGAAPLSQIDAHWPGVLTGSLAAYAVCGIFLGGLGYPHLFLLSGLTVAARRLTVQSQAGTRGRRAAV